jgi:large subunit ribosomal protein L4
MEVLKTSVYNLSGEKVGHQNLSPEIFKVAFNDDLVHQVVVAQQASGRQVLSHTKGRSEVRGGGRKPWKQKGTGRARHGSRRSPLWPGGGVTFGPTRERNFAKAINRKMKKKALRMVLSDKVKNDRFLVIDQWSIEKPKTKSLNLALKTLPSNNEKITLITEQSNMEIIRASRNLPKVASLGIKSLNVVDLLKNEFIIIPKKLVSVIEKTY